MEHEPQDVAGIEEGDNDSVSREGNFVIQDHVSDARRDEFSRCIVIVAGYEVPATDGLRQGPEPAVVVIQNVHLDKAVQSQIDDRLRARGEPLDPELRVPLDRFVRDFLQDGVKDGIADFRFVQGNQGFQVRVNAACERQFREYRADDGAVQLPAGHLVKVAALFVEEHQDELLG